MGVIIDFVDFYKFIRKELKTPYCRGTNDCVLLTVRSLDCIHGTSIFKEFKHTYVSRKDSTALLESYGGVAGLLDHLNLEQVPDLFMRIGDVIKSSTDREPLCLGIFLGRHKGQKCVLSVDVDLGTCITELPDTYTSWRLICRP